MRFIIILLCLGSFLIAKAEDLSVGFIYKKDIPEEAFYLYDWLIVDPDNFKLESLKEKFYIKKRKAKLIAYVSIGELEPYRDYYKKADKSWIIGENKGWKSKIADLRKDEYIQFLINEVFEKHKNYNGFFLDTMDSYQMVLKDEAEKKKYEEGLVKLVNILRQKYPDKIILANRPFEIIDKIKDKIDGFVAESLFYGLEIGKEIRYKKMKEEDTKWLLDKLNYVKSLGVKVIVIDYVDPRDRKLQKEVAKMIYQRGFIPYVTDKHLNSLGVSIYQLIPRKVLLIYDDKVFKDPIYSNVHRLVQPWVEYYGYVPVIKSAGQVIDEDRFKDIMVDEYAGIVVDVSEGRSSDFRKWIIDKKREGLKIFFVNRIPYTDDEFLKEFGITKEGDLKLFDRYKLVKSDFNFFETEPRFEEIPILNVEKAKYSIEFVDEKDKKFVPFAITEWGGYGLEGAFLLNLDKDSLFVINPLEVFKKVFDPKFPIPDVTTENGRRILTAHIDGDGFFGVADFNPSKNLGEIIRDEILKKYRIPHTISIIEGEIAPYGLYPEKSSFLESVAKSIFQLSNVEPASHSFSHPFKWQLIEKAVSDNKNINEGYNLNIKNYTFDLKREIVGSIEYINRNLLPKDKTVKAFLWTGDCIPSKNALKLTYEAGVYNVNGGNTWINEKEPFYSLISPMGFDRDGYFQVYSAVQNENVYTDLWRDYFGYIRVIDTFKMTEKPVRLKPISIYYHFYSGQKLASLKALKEVYNYVMKQNTNPIFLSEYAQRVLEFRNMAIGEDIRDDKIVIRSEGNLKTVRLDIKDIYPDIIKSKGVAGFSVINNSIYFNLDNSGDYKIIFSNSVPNFYLKDSNGQITEMRQIDRKVFIKLKSYVPLEFSFYDKDCKTSIKPTGYQIEKDGENITIIIYKEEEETYVEADCSR
ncbi:MAG: endo alpha-1,4 polygalactosaminidase [Hydrogenothermaceae bacterium]